MTFAFDEDGIRHWLVDYLVTNIGCPDHGPFAVIAEDHLAGEGCPLCDNLKTVRRFLDCVEQNIAVSTLEKYGPIGGTPCFVLIRSSTGHWSIHAPGASHANIADGTAPPLHDGTANFIEGEWNRPNELDYSALALKLWEGTAPTKDEA